MNVVMMKVWEEWWLVTEAVVAEFSQSEVSEAQQQQRSQWDRGGQGAWSVVQTVITINHNTAYWS